MKFWTIWISAALVIAISALACVSEDRMASPSSLPAFAEPFSRTKGGMSEGAVEGRVRLVVVAARTLSEYSYYSVITQSFGEVVLFDQSGTSSGFGKWVGKVVVVQGKPMKGKIGFKGEEREGLSVESIRENP